VTGASIRSPVALLVCWTAAALVGPAAAQTTPSHPANYLLGAEASDARALLLQPAGLSARREATLGGFLDFSKAGSSTELAQYGVLLASRGLGLGWRHDRAPGASTVNTWAVGYALGGPALGFGLARRWLRGDSTHDATFDLGLRSRVGSRLLVAAAWRDIGSPVVRGASVPETLTPGALLLLAGGRAHAGVDWELRTDDWAATTLRLGVAVPLPRGLQLSARADFGSGLDAYRGFALAVTWNRPGLRSAAYAAWPDGGAADHHGFWLAALRPLDSPRRRF
jgi:hypothetical protein